MNICTVAVTSYTRGLPGLFPANLTSVTTPSMVTAPANASTPCTLPSTSASKSVCTTGAKGSNVGGGSVWQSEQKGRTGSLSRGEGIQPLQPFQSLVPTYTQQLLCALADPVVFENDSLTQVTCAEIVTVILDLLIVIDILPYH